MEAKKHEVIISKLDKLLDQNKTIAEGMVAIVEMVKKKLGESDGTMFRKNESQEPMFRSRSEPKQFARPQQAWQPEQVPKPQPMPIAQPTMLTPAFNPQPGPQPFVTPDFGTQMPPMEPTPSPDFDFPEEPFPMGEEPKKKGLFGMFKK